jgi:hypothetical protein
MAFFEDEIKISGATRKIEAEESLDVDFNNEDEDKTMFLDNEDSFAVRETEDNFADLEEL